LVSTRRSCRTARVWVCVTVVAEVEVVGDPASGERDVADFTGQRTGSVELRGVDGGAWALWHVIA
jgi:hypothetical protein